MRYHHGPRRLVQVVDVDHAGRRRTLLATADEGVVKATEEAIRTRLGTTSAVTAGGRVHSEPEPEPDHA